MLSKDVEPQSGLCATHVSCTSATSAAPLEALTVGTASAGHVRPAATRHSAAPCAAHGSAQKIELEYHVLAGPVWCQPPGTAATPAGHAHVPRSPRQSSTATRAKANMPASVSAKTAARPGADAMTVASSVFMPCK